MSWDVFIARFPAELTDPRDVPGEWLPPPIGTNSEVRSTIQRVVPELQVGPDGHARYDGPGFSLSVDLAGDDDDDCDIVTLWFRGSGDAAAGLAVAITEALDARAISTGGEKGFLERGTAQEAWQSWQRYRDHVANSPPGADS